MSDLSQRRMDDVPFIGSDDMHYEFESGGKFVVDKFYASFEDWYDEQIGYGFRSEMIIDAIKTGDVEETIKYINTAWELGRKLGYEEASAFGCDNNVEYDV